MRIQHIMSRIGHVLLCMVIGLYAAGQSHHVGILPNQGQLHDQLGNTADHVAYYFNQAGLQVVINDKGFAYELFEQVKDSIYMHRIEFNLVDADLKNKHVTVVDGNGLVNRVDRFNADLTWTLPHYQKLIFENVYPGIDLEFDVSSGEFKYNFLLAPQSNANKIRFQVMGAEAQLDKQDIAIQTRFGEMRETIPMSFIKKSAKKIDVDFVAFPNQTFGYTTSEEHRQTCLGQDWVIDPTPNRLWGSYWGGTSIEFNFGLSEDNLGNVYICGVATGSPGFTTAGAHQVVMQGESNDAFIAKFNNNGIIQWCTYFGGNAAEIARGIVAQGDGTTYITGNTNSTAGLATTGAYRTVYGGGTGDGFLCKFSTAGVLQWSTYWGGTGEDIFRSVDFDPLSNMVVAVGQTRSASLASSGVHQTTNGGGVDACAAQFNSSGNYQWSTYFGGTGEEIAYGVAYKSNATIVIGGSTASTTNIASAGAQQLTYGGAVDGFLLHLNTNGTRIWSTYQGGSSADALKAVEVDFAGNLLGFGQTSSTANIATAGAFQATAGGSSDAFLAKFDDLGTKLWATYIGDVGIEDAMDVAVDTTNNIYICGITSSTATISTAGAHQLNWAGGYDGMIMQFTNAGVKNWGTYYGGNNTDWLYGIHVDLIQDIFVAGFTSSNSGIGTAGTSQPNHSPGVSDDPFVVRFGPLVLPVELGEWKSSCSEKNWSVEWQTLSEVNSDFFEVQASADGIAWSAIGSKPAAEASQQTIDYQITDENWQPEWRYLRLVLHNLGGQSEVLHTAFMPCAGEDQQGLLFPNPTSDHVVFRGNVQRVEVFNAMGQKHLSIQLNQTQSLYEWSTNLWPNGIYTVVVYDGQTWSSYKLVKQ